MAYHSSNGDYSGDERESKNDVDEHESEIGDKPVYLLEHLATFTVNKESGIVHPADGMRKLLQLEKTTGIWSQKMQLCLDRTWVLIMDYETGNVIERFAASLIQEPKAFTSNDPLEMYNNILVFIVGGAGAGSRSEMHIFQCQSISAVHLVEDLKLLRNGKTLPSQPKNMDPGSMSSEPTINQNEVNRDSQQKKSYRAHMEFMSPDSDSELGLPNDETSSTDSDKYERDVTVLNHCFDDIEKFIARLQHSAAAARELERRRRSRKSKKKDPGEGLLTLRTRPPQEKEFVDIFAKFKLSFNLLAKLKAHIHDPNAPELIHFLFTPLALIVDASHDTYYDPNLPARVINPLLTREAINLLINCVTSKETELWRSLGDAWTIPRDQWHSSEGIVSTYHPVFFDGWSPDYPVIDELEDETNESHLPSNSTKRISNANLEQSESISKNEYISDYGNFANRDPALRGDLTTRSEISLDSIERNNEDSQTDSWLEDLKVRGAKIVQVTYPRTANNDKELTVVRGEFLEILDDSRKWWKARNSRGQVAHVPHTIVQDMESNKFNNNDNNSEINANASSSVQQSSSEWGRNMIGRKEEKPVNKEIIIKKNMNQEIQQIFSTLKTKQHIKLKPPEIYIQESSSPEEIVKWLNYKKFTDIVIDKFNGLSGEQLFQLPNESIIELCGVTEGKRLISHLTVQKNVSGYKTITANELQKVLNKFRQKVE